MRKKMFFSILKVTEDFSTDPLRIRICIWIHESEVRIRDPDPHPDPYQMTRIRNAENKNLKQNNLRIF
jgi:hypothetical protein